jgi:hypothetical protein
MLHCGVNHATLPEPAVCDSYQSRGLKVRTKHRDRTRKALMTAVSAECDGFVVFKERNSLDEHEVGGYIHHSLPTTAQLRANNAILF